MKLIHLCAQAGGVFFTRVCRPFFTLEMFTFLLTTRPQMKEVRLPRLSAACHLAVGFQLLAFVALFSLGKRRHHAGKQGSHVDAFNEIIV